MTSYFSKKVFIEINYYFISSIWIINGLFCKVLGFVPRHEQIVAKITGKEYSKTLTLIIGFSEIILASWILTKFKSKISAITQIIIVFIMNVLEFSLAPDLLLWGKFNFTFAFLFMIFVYSNEFVLKKKLTL